MKDSTATEIDLYDHLIAALASVSLKPRQLLVVCLGGGADSQTLLDLVDRFRQQHPQYNYLAIHLDHEFHQKSGAWEASLRADCEQRQFPYHGEVIPIPRGARISKEAAGREVRYRRLKQLALTHQQQLDASLKPILLVGQHRNDQIETFLLQLKRGAGPKGLSSMSDVSAISGEDNILLRPLLQVSKAQIYAYAKGHQLHWIEDDTNYDTSIDRNYLRHEVVPKLEQRWPQFGNAVHRSASLCAEQQQLLDELLAVQLSDYIATDNSLAIGWLEQASVQLQRACLRFWLAHCGASMPSYAQLEQLRLQMLHSENDRQPKVCWGDYCVVRTNQPRRNRQLRLINTTENQGEAGE